MEEHVDPAENNVSRTGYQNQGVGSNYFQRSRRDKTEALHVKERRTRSRPIKTKMETLIVRLGRCWLKQRFLF